MNGKHLLYQLMMYLNCAFEVYLLYYFLKALFPVPKQKKWRIGTKIIGCAVAVYLVNQLNLPLVNTLCVPLIFILFLWFSIPAYFMTGLPFCIFYYLILSIFEIIFGYLYFLLAIDTTQVNTGRVLLLLLQNILRFITTWLMKRNYHIPCNSNCYSYTKTLYILPVAAMILFNGFLAAGQHPYGDILLITGNILLIVSGMSIFSVIEKLLHAQDTIRNNELLLLKANLEKEHFKKMEKVNQEYASYIHDMHHVLRTISQLADTKNNQEIKQISSEANQLLHTKPPLARQNYIADTIVNSIINERERDAKERGIQFLIHMEKWMDLSFMSDLDKIRIFGNLLDNAMEAAADCEDGYIHLSLHQGNPFFIILQIVNNFQHQNEKKGETYLTIKKNKAIHGFGLRNAKELAEKYGGSMIISEEKNTFSVKLLLSNAAKLENSSAEQ